MIRSLIAILWLCAASSARADTVCWNVSSGVLPDDPAVLAEHRFTLSGRTGFLSLGPTLRVVDDVRVDAVYMTKTDLAALTSSDDWEFEIVQQMHSDDRDSGWLDIGIQTSVHDDQKRISLGVHVSAVGFVDEPSKSWVDNLAVNMDASDALHLYRVVKTGAVVDL